MADAEAIFENFLSTYASVVTANDADAYRDLFTRDAIRVPANSVVERGPDEIAASEGRDYEEARWSVELQPVDVLALGDSHILGLAHADASLEFYADGALGSKDAMKVFLLERQGDDWLISRYLWNVKPE